ncbi:MAG: CvpA family protein, partial [Desulfobacterales bacterium]
MNPFDILIIIILGYSLIRGLFRGLVKEVASIIGVLGGF